MKSGIKSLARGLVPGFLSPVNVSTSPPWKTTSQTKVLLWKQPGTRSDAQSWSLWSLFLILPDFPSLPNILQPIQASALPSEGAGKSTELLKKCKLFTPLFAALKYLMDRERNLLGS